MCFDCLYKFVCNTLILNQVGEILYQTYIGLQAQCCYSCQILMKPELSRKFRKTLNTKFHKNPASRRRDLPCGRTAGQT